MLVFIESSEDLLIADEVLVMMGVLGHRRNDGGGAAIRMSRCSLLL